MVFVFIKTYVEWIFNMYTMHNKQCWEWSFLCYWYWLDTLSFKGEYNRHTVEIKISETYNCNILSNYIYYLVCMGLGSFQRINIICHFLLVMVNLFSLVVTRFHSLFITDYCHCFGIPSIFYLSYKKQIAFRCLV